MARLTLSIDSAVVARARRYAARRNTSVSRLVEDYLRPLVEVEPDHMRTPVKAMRGILKAGDREDYRRYLVKKYS
ncbi:MAG TPA: DUF6364 family protein [Bryobacteraceae bacterium]|nr:DUF6364 family protein [Bryobacteraceae bacterium]